MSKKKKKPARRKRSYTILLSNHADRQDDESIKVMAFDSNDALEECCFDESRFSVRGVYLTSDLKGRWV